MSPDLAQRKITNLPLSKLHIDEEKFQLRDFTVDGPFSDREKRRSDEHVKTLAEAVDRHDALPPMDVWKDHEGKYFVVDGHHRYKAYRKVFKPLQDQTAPIRLLPEGTTINEARLHALSANKDNKLSMTKSQKTEAAWKVICGDSELVKLSVRKISTLLGHVVSHTTASDMKKARKQLQKEDELDDPLSWKQVKAKKWNHEDFDFDLHEQRLIEKLCKEFTITTNKLRCTDPNLIAKALEMSLEDSGGIYEVTIRTGYENDSDYLEDDEEF